MPKLNQNQFQNRLRFFNFDKQDLSKLYRLYQRNEISKSDLKNHHFLNSKLKEKKIKFDTLNANTIYRMALNFNLEDIQILAQTNKRIQSIIYENNEFWKEYYQKYFEKEHLTPLQEIQRHHNRLKAQNKDLLNFIKVYTNYDNYSFEGQTFIYNIAKTSFDKINKDPNFSDMKLVTSNDIYGDWGEYLIRTYLRLTTSFGIGKESVYPDYFDVNDLENTIFDTNEHILAFLKVYNSLYNDNVKLKEGIYD